jgi:hypothetical protein
VWLALGNDGRRDGLEQVLPEIEAIAQFADELRQRLAGDGVDGLEGTLGLCRRLKGTLDAIPGAELQLMRAHIEALARWLGEVARRLEAVGRVKRSLNT